MLLYIDMSSPELFCLALEELEPGKVSVRAPVAKDAVQVEWFGNIEELCELDVIVDPDSVSIKRKDEEELQINLYGEGIKDVDYYSSVLGEPVDEIIFRRLGSFMWAVEPEDVEVINLSGLQIFADVLGKQAKKKQRNA